MGNKRPLNSFLESRVFRAWFDDCSNKMRGIITQSPKSKVQSPKSVLLTRIIRVRLTANSTLFDVENGHES